MTLIFSNHRFQYEVERLFRNFINEPGIKLSTDKADAQGDFCLTEKVEYPGGAELSVDLVREGKRFCMSRSIPGGMPEKEQERELCILLYKALREYTGRDLPWGILTGVRPVKVLSKLTDAQAFQSLLVSPRKLAVSRRIEQVQKPLADSIPENSFSLYVSIPFCPTRCSYCSFPRYRGIWGLFRIPSTSAAELPRCFPLSSLKCCSRRWSASTSRISVNSRWKPADRTR